MNSSGKESFVSVHIANSGDNALVEKRSLYRYVMPAESLPQNAWRELSIEWLGTQFADYSLDIVHQPHFPQPAPIAEDKAMSVGEAKGCPDIATVFPEV